MAMVETHVLEQGSNDLLHDWMKAGYKAVLTPATRSQVTDSLNSGGAVIGARAVHQAVSFRHLAKRKGQCVGTPRFMQDFQEGPIDFYDFVAIGVKVKADLITVIAAYFTDGVGLAGPNLAKARSIAAFVATLGGPWLVLADYNMPPQYLEDTGLLRMIQGEVILPDNTEFTCTAGNGNMLDYVVASPMAARYVRRVYAQQEDWKPHWSVTVELCTMPEHAMQW
eukprot:2194523-Lingulodinium_polyedra.AAC.1